MSHIHVISFQNPAPPDYGGVIDVYYKLKALKEAGFRITLHTYNYRGRDAAAPSFFREEDEVIYYERKESPLSLLSTLPYIVNSRRAPDLLKNLSYDNDPILFEGLHTTHLLSHPLLHDRMKIVRAHNVEHDYYRGLALSEKRVWKRIYFQTEAYKLERYEKVLRHSDFICAISEKEKEYFERAYPEVKTIFLPGFYDDSSPEELPGGKGYVLYQGSLDVSENISAAERIINHIAPLLHDVEFVIAGRNPSEELMEKAKMTYNVRLIANPDNEEFSKLLNQARVNLLLTEQATGVKLKLLHALCRGAHLVVNSKMVEGTGLEKYCVVADSDEELANAIRLKIEEPFLNFRILPDRYINSINIRSLKKILDFK
ncbi:MAG: glycosyltransferase [Muribaculaceae bacterium]|nr:glycosyltransferase [Muribaculaceae bacterium]